MCAKPRRLVRSMNIISYRGPGKAGGVSSTLARLWTENTVPGTAWWYLTDNTLERQDRLAPASHRLASLPQTMIEAHYRYCNEFLWPVLHDLPQYAVYKQEDHKAYNSLNRILSRMIARDRRKRNLEPVFVQDYQLALLPELLSRTGALNVVTFWHIPWPKLIDSTHAPHLLQIARGLLSSNVIGFHTEEYAKNFLDFVEAHIGGLKVDHKQKLIKRKEGIIKKAALPWSQEEPPHAVPDCHKKPPTVVLVAPLGIDVAFWEKASALPQLRLHREDYARLHSMPYILSVDRADYTKGVLERLAAIDCFFEHNPEWRGKVVFAQICGRTRPGLEAFDRYWNQCKIEASKLECRWHSGNWSPLVWIEQPFTAEELAVLYRRANLMLVNPIRDGLNLTAKEFAAAQVDRTGILALSPGAGAWHELGQHSVDIDPLDCEGAACAIAAALTIERKERARRLDEIQQSLRANTLIRWWNRIDEAVSTHVPAAKKPLRALRAVSAPRVVGAGESA